MIAPCKDCPERTIEPNCHDSCERYLEFKRSRQAELDAHAADMALTAYHYRTMARVERRTHRRHHRRMLDE